MMKDILLGNELLIIFIQIADSTYGLEINNVVSIIEAQKIRFVPQAPEYINSIVNYHGRIVTIFDMKTYFKCNDSPLSKVNKVIYLKQKEQHIGLLVDNIIKIDYVSPSCIESIPEDQLNRDQADFCQGLFVLGEDFPLTYWLDTQKIKNFISQINL